MKKTSLQKIGIAALIVGSLLLAFLGVISTWGEIEASFFDAALAQMDPLSTLRCPSIITPNEDAYVSARFSNPDDNPIDLEIRTYVTDGYVTLMNEYINNVTVEPGATEKVEVPVYPENAAYNRIVMVRMHQMKRVPQPYRNAACGIIVFNVPFLTGSQLVALIIGLGIILSVGGIGLWALNSKPIIWHKLKIFQAMIIFSVTSLLVSIIGLLNLWLLGVIIIVIWILMGVGMIWQFSVMTESNPYKKNQSSDS